MYITEYRNVNDLIKNKGKHAGFISIGPAPFEKNVLLRLHEAFHKTGGQGQFRAICMKTMKKRSAVFSRSGRRQQTSFRFLI